MTVYEPQEDSELLEKEVRKFARGIVLDIGTGSGVQAIAAAENANAEKPGHVDYVIAVDINEEALEKAERKARACAYFSQAEDIDAVNVEKIK